MKGSSFPGRGSSTVRRAKVIAHPNVHTYTPELLLTDLLNRVREDPEAIDRLVIVFDDLEGNARVRWTSQKLGDVAIFASVLNDSIVSALKGTLPGFERDE